jgi:outer membrane protein OmpA-like peptidoglycan-associated protein
MARWIVLAGITALLVTGYFATFYEHGQAHWRSVRFIEADLLTQARAAVTKTGATWAKVKMDGQVAILTGVAPSEADRDDLKLVVRAAAGPGGPWLGGITQVRDEMSVAPAKKPYTWSAKREADGRISLSGYVPGQRSRQAIGAEARKLFPAGVEDTTTVASGLPTGPWADTAIWSLRQLSQLQAGEANFVDGVITVRGQATTAEAQAGIYASAKTLARSYQGIADITVSTAPVALPEVPEETVAAPLAPATPSAQALSAEACQKLLDQVMADNSIAFASGSAKLRATSHASLNRMAQTAIDCGTRFMITGHVDGTSLELGLGDLDRGRAEAAAAYLAAKGVARDKMVIEGVGSSQPAADNSTVAGQTRNRRVEITVLP